MPTPLTPRSPSVAERAKANLSYRRGDYDQARDLLGVCIEEQTNPAQVLSLVHAQRSACWIAGKKYAQALIDSEWSLHLQPPEQRDWRVCAAAAEAFIGMKRYLDAIPLYLEALHAFPSKWINKRIEEILSKLFSPSPSPFRSLPLPSTSSLHPTPEDLLASPPHSCSNSSHCASPFVPNSYPENHLLFLLKSTSLSSYWELLEGVEKKLALAVAPLAGIREGGLPALLGREGKVWNSAFPSGRQIMDKVSIRMIKKWVEEGDILLRLLLHERAQLHSFTFPSTPHPPPLSFITNKQSYQTISTLYQQALLYTQSMAHITTGYIQQTIPTIESRSKRAEMNHALRLKKSLVLFSSLLRVRLASFSLLFYSQGDVLSRSLGGGGGELGRVGGPTLSSLQVLLKKATEPQERGEGAMGGGVGNYPSLFCRYFAVGSEGITPVTLPWSWWTETTSLDSSLPPSRALSPSRREEEEEVDVRGVMKEVEEKIEGWSNRVEWAGGLLSALSVLCESIREAHYLFAEERNRKETVMNDYPFLQPVLECLGVVLEMIISMRSAVSPQFLLDAITCLLKVHPITLNTRCYQLASALLEAMVGVASICPRWGRAMEGGGVGGKGGVHSDIAHWLVCCAHTFHGLGGEDLGKRFGEGAEEGEGEGERDREGEKESEEKRDEIENDENTNENDKESEFEKVGKESKRKKESGEKKEKGGGGKDTKRIKDRNRKHFNGKKATTKLYIPTTTDSFPKIHSDHPSPSYPSPSTETPPRFPLHPPPQYTPPSAKKNLACGDGVIGEDPWGGSFPPSPSTPPLASPSSASRSPSPSSISPPESPPSSPQFPFRSRSRSRSHSSSNFPSLPQIPLNNPSVSPCVSPSTSPTISPCPSPPSSPSCTPSPSPPASPSNSPLFTPSISPPPISPSLSLSQSTSSSLPPPIFPSGSPPISPPASPPISPSRSPQRSNNVLDSPPASPPVSPVVPPPLSLPVFPTRSPGSSHFPPPPPFTPFSSLPPPSRSLTTNPKKLDLVSSFSFPFVLSLFQSHHETFSPLNPFPLPLNDSSSRDAFLTNNPSPYLPPSLPSEIEEPPSLSSSSPPLPLIPDSSSSSSSFQSQKSLGSTRFSSPPPQKSTIESPREQNRNRKISGPPIPYSSCSPPSSPRRQSSRASSKASTNPSSKGFPSKPSSTVSSLHSSSSTPSPSPYPPNSSFASLKPSQKPPAHYPKPKPPSDLPPSPPPPAPSSEHKPLPRGLKIRDTKKSYPFLRAGSSPAGFILPPRLVHPLPLPPPPHLPVDSLHLELFSDDDPSGAGVAVGGVGGGMDYAGVPPSSPPLPSISPPSSPLRSSSPSVLPLSGDSVPLSSSPEPFPPSPRSPLSPPFDFPVNPSSSNSPLGPSSSLPSPSLSPSPPLPLLPPPLHSPSMYSLSLACTCSSCSCGCPSPLPSSFCSCSCSYCCSCSFCLSLSSSKYLKSSSPSTPSVPSLELSATGFSRSPPSSASSSSSSLPSPTSSSRPSSPSSSCPTISSIAPLSFSLDPSPSLALDTSPSLSSPSLSSTATSPNLSQSNPSSPVLPTVPASSSSPPPFPSLEPPSSSSIPSPSSSPSFPQHSSLLGSREDMDEMLEGDSGQDIERTKDEERKEEEDDNGRKDRKDRPSSRGGRSERPTEDVEEHPPPPQSPTILKKLQDLLVLAPPPPSTSSMAAVTMFHAPRILLLLSNSCSQEVRPLVQQSMSLIGDCTLVIQDKNGGVFKELTVFSDWLVQRSQYFEKMLGAKMRESHLRRIVLVAENHVRPTVVDQMIQYILSDTIDINETNVVELLVVSNKFQVTELYKKAFNYLRHHMANHIISLPELHCLYNVSCLLASRSLKQLILGDIWPHLESALARQYDPELAQHLRKEYPELLPFVAKILPSALHRLIPKMDSGGVQVADQAPHVDLSAEQFEHIGMLLVWFRRFFIKDKTVHRALHRKHLYERIVWANQLKLLEMLLESGVDPRECTSSRSPPLMGAIKHNSLEMVSVLLAAGVDANTEYPVTYGPILQRQLKKGYNPNFFVHLTAPPYISIEDLNVTMDGDMSPLTLAVAMAGADKFFDYRIIRILVKHGADVNLPSGTIEGRPQRNTALMIAAARGPSPLVQLLLELGANLEDGNRLGWTALHHAASAGNVEIVDILLKHGAKWSTRATVYEIDKIREVNLNKAYPKLYMTAREVAAYHKHYNVLKLMKKRGVEE